MSGGSKNTTTTVSNNEPWSAAQPYLTQNLAAAANVAPTQVYSGPRVADQSTQTQGGLGALSGLANANMNGQGLSGQLQNVINSGGFNSSQMDALNNTRQVANAQFDLNSDPGWAQVRDATIEGVNLGASGMGRTGSGTNQTLLASNLADAGARQYQNFLSRRDAANSNLFGMGQQGFGNLNAAYTGMQAPAQTLLDVGGRNDAYQQSLLNANIDAFDERQNAARNDVAWRQGIYSGAGSLGSSSTSKATQPGQSGLMTGLGYAASGLGLLGGFM